ncbi:MULTISPECIES: family 43 glycosylhydrolase [unclassified Flavobacterium]|uniref:family 43 glycosylhydrolase n=1 Tax=unclassified Flavobacterium TaxID=196869 RepID=UPI0025BAF427|nr:MULTISPECIES: family 43 glycosylhydrolase [unclassified Flavobacterium]
MKKLVFLILLVKLPFSLNAQYQKHISNKGSSYFLNPIFAGDYPDPSLLRDGNDYYIVHSSFEYYPGLLIWHSKDLINWIPVTHALHKYVGSVWAPDLVKYKNKYYIYFPANNTNYVIKADKIEGPWSDPVDLNIGNIDPGHITDKDGNRYLYFSSGGYVPLSEDGLSVVGKYNQVYSGWPIPRDYIIECFCMEGPKIVKRGEYYYLTTAEGGTAGPATSHMIISARSKSPLGPWENSPNNPILRTVDRSEKWWSKGHGTLFEDTNQQWWMVFHAYENGHYNMGRQTLLQPVEWTKDGWFKFPDAIKTDKPIKKPLGAAPKSTFTLNDTFDGNDLKLQWQFFGEYDPSRFSLADNTLSLKTKGNSIANCSPLLYIPSDHSYMAEVELLIEGNAIGGLVLFYNDNNAFSGILADNTNILGNIRESQFTTEENVIKKHVYLRLKNSNNTVNMYYSTDKIKWIKVQNSFEVSGLHHNALGGFLSLRLGLCAMGDGVVKFKNFVYQKL